MKAFLPPTGGWGPLRNGMKVVLSTPPGKTTELWPPLGLLYIASSTLSKRPDDIRVIDAFCENLEEDELVSRVCAESPEVFGMNCSTNTFMSAVGALRKISERLPETKLVLGGIHATFAGERILREYPFIDYILKGEGEISFPKLLDCIEGGTSPSGIDGVGYADDGQVIANPPVLIENLDSLPFPARDLVGSVEYGYVHRNIRLTYGRFATVSSSRGCPFRCAYCSCAAFSMRKWRPRGPENVVDELEHLYDEGYECCVFVDDNLMHSRERMERICDLIESRRIRMQFYCEGRVDNASLDLMRRMKQAGFNVIYFGVESPQKHVLDYYRKTITAEQSVKGVENAKKAGMLVVTSYIMGAPVESAADLMETIRFIRKVRPHGLQVNILDCLIGTEIWERLEKEALIGPDDWKTNHRIYEYQREGLSRATLEDMVNMGYSAHLEAWKSKEGMLDLLKTMLANETARTVVLKNLFNPDARRRIVDGRRFGQVSETHYSNSPVP
jgi:anaerobic magnesium-protoporphyrin IX monomethyl ester cyclase